MDSDKIVSQAFLLDESSCKPIAHYLKMVLDAGRLVEFDTPKNLLKNETGLLRALVDESSDKDVLLKLAET